MKTIRDIEYFEGVKVLVRADFNVPIVNGAVGDDFRIRATLSTIDFLRNKGAIVILMSHLESIDGDILSLEPIAKHLTKIGQPVTFIKDLKNAHQIIEGGVENGARGGALFLLENLRFSEGEKKNDKKFAQSLASLADIYVNEAFSASHREHASIVGVPQLLPSYAGLQFEKEVTHLSKAFNPSHPFFFVLGGAKFDTKLPLIERFSKVADAMFLGGALGNDALKARGINVGDSKISDGAIDISNIVSRTNILVPVDSIIQDRSVKNVADLAAHDQIFDPGPKTLELIRENINKSKFILWNGPLGPYENGFIEGTEAVAKMIAERTEGGGGGKREAGLSAQAGSTENGGGQGAVESIVGGGDTLAAIANLGIEDKFTFVSSGGGAMLEFLAKGTLPGIEALNKAQSD